MSSFGFQSNGSGGGGGSTFPFGGNYANYSALPAQPSNPNTLFYCIASQGTKWLPGSLGGTYYPLGWYYSDGATYTYQETPFQATQITVDAGINSDQFVTPLTLENAAQINYTNPLPSAITVGGIPAGSTFNAKKITYMFDALLYPELFPTLTAPTHTFALTQSGLHEIAEVIATLNFSATFGRGSISPAYGTNGFRSGLPNTYKYTGSGLSDFASVLLSDSQTVSSYAVISGVQSWTGIVAYDAGQQPLSSKGNNYSTPLSANDTNTITVSITGVYPVFATTVAIAVMTKQVLALMTSVYIEISMVAESGSDKQTIDFPTVWSVITGIQFFNTINNSWEWIMGSKANSLTTFTVTNTTHSIQGNTINYNRFTHNGSQIGSRQLRFYTT
jgi:hypothetical protein